MYKEDQNKVKRFYCNDHFSVSSICYSEDKEICALVVINDRGQTVYELKEKGAGTAGNHRGKAAGESGSKEKTAQKAAPKSRVEKPQEAPSSIYKEQMDLLQEELKRTGVAMEAVQERYKITAPESMNEKTYKRVMEVLAKTKAA